MSNGISRINKTKCTIMVALDNLQDWLTIGIFFAQFCEVGGLVIIHKRDESNLARGQAVKYICAYFW
jgi:hypothetical protein